MDVKGMIVDTVDKKLYKDVNLDAEPCIFPDCMHILTVTSMDNQLGMSDYYDIDQDGRIVGVKDVQGSTELKTCPTCGGGLHNISRYDRLTRHASSEECVEKLIDLSDSE